MPPKKNIRVECDIQIAPDCTGPDVRYKMLQGDAELLKFLPTMKGEEVVLKGCAEDEATEGGGAVLCTKSGTYEVTILETTNTCLLCKASDGGQPRVIHGSVSETQVLKRIPPAIKRKLGRMLDEGGLAGDAGPDAPGFEEYGDDPDLPAKRPRHYTTEELVAGIRASRDEVCAALAAAPAVEDAAGRWRVARPDDVDGCLETLLRVGAMEFDLFDFDYDAALACLSEYHDHVVAKACLKAFTGPKLPEKAAAGKDKADGEGPPPARHELSTRHVCVAAAAKLFARNSTWDFEAFMAEWAAACPAVATPQEVMLEGFAVVYNASAKSTARTVRHLPSDSLPPTPKERFAAMFAIMDKWPKKVLEVYIQPLVGPGLKLTQLLSRYTREFPVNGVPTCVPF